MKRRMLLLLLSCFTLHSMEQRTQTASPQFQETPLPTLPEILCQYLTKYFQDVAPTPQSAQIAGAIVASLVTQQDKIYEFITHLTSVLPSETFKPNGFNSPKLASCSVRPELSRRVRTENLCSYGSTGSPRTDSESTSDPILDSSLEMPLLMPSSFMSETVIASGTVPLVTQAAYQSMAQAENPQAVSTKGLPYRLNCQCSICKKSFKPYGIKQHIRQSHPDYFICTHRGCPYCTDRKEDFDDHVNCHVRGIHQCTYENCTYSTDRQKDLEIHKRSHTGEKPFACSFEGCLKAFASQRELTRHKQMHEGPLPHCSLCNRYYTTLSSFYAHQRLKHQEKKMA